MKNGKKLFLDLLMEDFEDIEEPEVRICEHCNSVIIPDEPDPCLKGYIPGVKYACCGHGTCEANIMFNNRVNISGPIAFLFLEAYKEAYKQEQEYINNTLDEILNIKNRVKEVKTDGRN